MFLILDLTSRHLKGWCSALVTGGLWQEERADDVQQHTFVQLFHWFFSAKTPSDLWSGTWMTGLFHVMWQIQLLFKQTLAGQMSLSVDRRTFRSTQWQTPRTEALLWPLHTASKAFHQLHFLSLFPPVEPPPAPSFLLHFWRKKKPKADSGRETRRQKAYKDDKNISPQNQKDGRLPNEEFGARHVVRFSIDIKHKISHTYLISSVSCLSINCVCCCPDVIG